MHYDCIVDLNIASGIVLWLEIVSNVLWEISFHEVQIQWAYHMYMQNFVLRNKLFYGCHLACSFGMGILSQLQKSTWFGSLLPSLLRWSACVLSSLVVTIYTCEIAEGVVIGHDPCHEIKNCKKNIKICSSHKNIVIVCNTSSNGKV